MIDKKLENIKSGVGWWKEMCLMTLEHNIQPEAIFKDGNVYYTSEKNDLPKLMALFALYDIPYEKVDESTIKISNKV